MARILVTGGEGQLAHALQDAHILEDTRYLGHAQLDVTDRAHVRQILQIERPEWVINCAAYTQVDAAETHSPLAYAVNESGVRFLVETCEKIGARLLHISTDYVFGGSGNIPHKEDAVVHPESVYAKSKRAGELAVLSSDCGIVLRTSWLYSYYERNFFRTILTHCLRGNTLRVVADQIGTPTWAGNLARVIGVILAQPTPLNGILHYSDSGACSWYDFACAIAQCAQSSSEITPIATEDWDAPAPRPRFSLLDCRKTLTRLGLRAPDWQTGLRTCYAELRARKGGQYYRATYTKET